MHSEIIHQNKY